MKRKNIKNKNNDIKDIQGQIFKNSKWPPGCQDKNARSVISHRYIHVVSQIKGNAERKTVIYINYNTEEVYGQIFKNSKWRPLVKNKVFKNFISHSMSMQYLKLKVMMTETNINT